MTWWTGGKISNKKRPGKFRGRLLSVAMLPFPRGVAVAGTASKVKNRYNEKVYDRISLVVPKGKKEELQAYAANQGESLNAFVNRAITEAINRQETEEA